MRAPPRHADGCSENAERNRCTATLRAFNLDGREFVRNVVQRIRQDASGATWRPFRQVIMNLPAVAIEFLDVFRGLFSDDEAQRWPMPIIHCYCFVRRAASDADAARNIRRRVYASLIQHPAAAHLPSAAVGDDAAVAVDEALDAAVAAAFAATELEELTVRHVRSVAPSKAMYEASFVLPRSIACASPTAADADAVLRDTKRVRRSVA